MGALSETVPARVSGEMNREIMKAYSEEGIKHALFQMAPSKAPGVDGFTAGFFQRHWQLLKQDIVCALLEFPNGGELPAAKAIANRLRACLDEVIGEEQSAFVPGRLITDNVLIAYESVHYMRRRKTGKNSVCAVKLDMMKAYDCVE
ncbi:Pleiotropic drug resistance protein 4 [Hordeum vulgare]|nr:Pleiotropic drug resistance protein 4 [Hordeum vulgare]